jgi:outer membrane protein assembly factor BamB
MADQSGWWMYHGDTAHTGNAGGSEINSLNVGRLEILYSLELSGPLLSVPAVVDGHIYCGLANTLDAPDANGGRFLKIDLATGSIVRDFRWSTKIGEGDSHGFMGMACTPAVTGTRIYFMALNGKLYCLNRKDLELEWVLDLRNADPAHNQPVTNPWDKTAPPPSGWCSPLVVNAGRPETVYVGIGEGENPLTFGFVYSVDGKSGQVNWIYSTCQFQPGVPNAPNVLPPCCVCGDLPPGSQFRVGPVNPKVRGCSIWSSIAWDQDLNRLYCATGNAYPPDSTVPSNDFGCGILSLDAATGGFRQFFQALPESNYRPTDDDVDFGGSPMLFTVNGRRMVCAGCKNGGFFVLDAETLKCVQWRQLLPLYNDGSRIPTVDRHVDGNENYFGTYSTPAVHNALGILFIGVGGNNYHEVPGIDYTTTPFLRAMRWDTLEDAWPMDQGNPRKYTRAQPPMYRTPAESGLSSPAVVNDIVFCSTTKVALYAFSAVDGCPLWSDQLGDQTGGMSGNYGYCLGPAIWENYVVAGALVFGRGGILRVYSLPEGAY